MTAEERLLTYNDDMACLVAMMQEFNKLDISTLEVNARQLESEQLIDGVSALKRLVDNTKWMIDLTKERIEGIREYVRFGRQKQEAYERREYRRSR